MRPLLAGASALLAATAISASPALGGEISTQNVDEAGKVDGALFPDRLIFNHVKFTSGVVAKTTAAVRIVNSDSTPLTVTSLQTTGPYAVDPAVALPAVIPAGGNLVVTVRFTTTAADPARQDGTLVIGSDDADEPTTTIQLAGLSQLNTGGSGERTLAQLLDTFGYKTVVVNANQKLAFHGRVQAVGDEVISPYWRRADTTKPVIMRALGAFHGPGTNTTSWFAKNGPVSSTTGLPVLKTIMRHDAAEWQTLLPHEENLNPAFRDGVRSFTPTAEVFSFKVSDSWADPQFNPKDTTSYCDDPVLEPCGHYIRFYPAKDRAGNVIPNGWIMAMDFPLKNYDYNDNVFFLANVMPETAVADTVKPTVSQRTPAPNAVEVSPSGNVVVTFSEPVAPASVTAASAALTQAGVPVTATRTLNATNTQLTIDPAADLALGTTYGVSLTSGITDVAGNTLDPVAWSFTTTAPDTTKPTVTARVPAPDAVSVSRTGDITVTFSEPLAPGSVSATSAALSQAGTPVAASRTLASGNTQLVIDPDADLAGETAYTVDLGSGLTDVAGNTLDPVTWSFTTEPAPVGPGPYLFVGNQVVMEAENADEIIGRSGKAWQNTGLAGAVGTSMQALSDSGTIFEAGVAAAQAPELRFQVQFPAAGTYRLAIRGNAPSTSSNSVHVGLNGVISANSDNMVLGTFTTWGWFAPSTGGPNPATISVPSAGVHTVSVYPREDGMIVDRIVVATPGTATPTGNGPAESPRA